MVCKRTQGSLKGGEEMRTRVGKNNQTSRDSNLREPANLTQVRNQ